MMAKQIRRVTTDVAENDDSAYADDLPDESSIPLFP
jgi:hypothetical protein